MLECKCGNSIKEGKKFCSKSCANKYKIISEDDKIKHSERTKAAMVDYYNNKFGPILKIDKNCIKCNNIFTVFCREKDLIGKKYCSKSCSNKRIQLESTKLKISESLKILNPDVIINCKQCNNEFKRPRKHTLFCSVSCATKYSSNLPLNKEKSRIRGLKISQNQENNKRSKNEILFANLCIHHFTNVLINDPIFNGWDADVIIEDLKIAILWNGKWHYEKITKKHSVTQVQNRDKIKIKEIIKAGYVPYIIKDMGRYNSKFVKSEFNKFLMLINNKYVGPAGLEPTVV